MAALNYSGMLLASKGKESDEDAYEEDDDEDDEMKDADPINDAKKRKKYS